MDISIVVITRDAEYYLPDLLDSLVTQAETPLEIIIVDSDSRDRTPEIAKSYGREYNFIKFFNYAGHRGESRNYGAKKAQGDVVAFIDADCIANAFWTKEIRRSIEAGADIVAGRTVKLGYEGFTGLKRVGIMHKGVDITYPSSNLIYRKEVFEAVGGFDPWFKEAEEIDLNYRAVDKGYKLVYNDKAVVYHRARETFKSFFKQSFWYGFGRKELTLRHGSLWQKYDVIDMVRIEEGESIWKIVRLGIASMGYMFCIVTKGNEEAKEKFRRSAVSSR